MYVRRPCWPSSAVKTGQGMEKEGERGANYREYHQGRLLTITVLLAVTTAEEGPCGWNFLFIRLLQCDHSQIPPSHSVPSHHVFTALQCILHILTVLWGELVCYTKGLCLGLSPGRDLRCNSAGQALVAALQCVEFVAQLLSLVQQRELVWGCMRRWLIQWRGVL